MIAFDLIFVLVGVLGLAVVLFRDEVLPPRFSFDGQRIQGIASGHISALGDSAFGNVAAVYKFLGLSDHSGLASVLGYLLLIGVLALVRRQMTGRAVPLGAVIVLVLSLVFGAVYLGYYSKDVFVLVIAGLAVALPRRWQAEVVLLLGMAAYASTVRSYWFIVLGMYLALRLGLRGPVRVGRLLCIVVLGIVLLAFAVQVWLGVDADHFRTAVNESRTEAADANSVILPLLDVSGGVAGIVNVLWAAVTLVIPIPLALLGGIYYLITSVVFVTLWAVFVQAVRRAAGRAVAISAPAIDKRAVALLLAFLCAQALFEPDYGSALRHLTPLFPLFMWLSVSAANFSPRQKVTR